MIALLLLALPVSLQDPRPDPAAADLARIRAAFTGSFLGVERKDGREGTGHIVARALPGGFIGRDYWSEGGGRRLYAGHDVLWLGPAGGARHWWFGGRGDEAYAEGDWTPARLELIVRDDDGDPLRRYTYALAPAEGVAFSFRNDHAARRGWVKFMGATWRRTPVELPADFRPRPEEEEGSWRAALVGAWSGPAGPCQGRRLFGEWLVLDGAGEHAVLAESWFGRLRLWTWSEDGALAWAGRRQDGILRFRSAGTEAEGDWPLQWVLSEGGMGLLRRQEERIQDLRAAGG